MEGKACCKCAECTDHIHLTGYGPCPFTANVDAECPGRREGHVGAEPRDAEKNYCYDCRFGIEAYDKPDRRQNETTDRPKKQRSRAPCPAYGENGSHPATPVPRRAGRPTDAGSETGSATGE